MNLFVKALTVIDASYLCETRGMVGESWILDISLSGALNEMSMVLDFGQVKKQIKHLVDQYVDHRLIVPMRNAAIHYEPSDSGYLTLDLMRGEKSIHLCCPEEAYCLIDSNAVTVETVTKHLYQLLKSHLPDNIRGIEITLRHENIDGAFYHYSHGLKKHDGNCQRIAHGHRSPIELIVNGKRDHQRESAFARRWKDIYLGSVEDQVSVEMLTLNKRAIKITDDSHFGFCYTAPQGKFELAIAKCETELINSDTTIELLANYIADEVQKSMSSVQTLKVVAYEGVGKGAIAAR